VFEQLGVAYAPRPMLGTDAFSVSTRKRKADAAGRVTAKKVKVAPVKKVGIVKIVRPKPRNGPTGMSAIELALAKPIGVSTKFCFSDVPNPSLAQHEEGGLVVQATGECAAQVLKFASLGDSSPV
jgi:hypothetical protein